MGFLDKISSMTKSRLEIEVDEKLAQNIIPAYFITHEGQTKSIYDRSVLLGDVLEFFSDRLPGIKFQFPVPLEELEQDPILCASLKTTCFLSCVNALEVNHKKFGDAFRRQGLVQAEEMVGDTSIH